jgi:hypothetical protein
MSAMVGTEHRSRATASASARTAAALG